MAELSFELVAMCHDADCEGYGYLGKARKRARGEGEGKKRAKGKGEAKKRAEGQREGKKRAEDEEMQWKSYTVDHRSCGHLDIDGRRS